MALRVTHHVTKEETTLSQILKSSFRFNKKEADSLFRLGAIYYEENRVFEDRTLPKGAHLKMYLKPTRYPVNGLKWKDFLVAEEKDFIVINKPPEIPTHATVDNWYENALFQMRSYLNTGLFVTQRLDTPVSGLLLFAKTKAFQSKFNLMLQKGQVKKRYSAYTETAVPLGVHTHYMERSARVPKHISTEAGKLWDVCQLKIVASKAKEKHFESQIELMTGRTHQIRAQLSFLGSPILGDKLYQSHAKWEGRGIGLFSKALSFEKFDFKI